MSKTSVTLSAIETYVKNTTKREGPDALEQAWQVAQSEGAQSDFSGFILLAARLQESRPGEPILLPLERTAKMMDVHVTQVTRWRKRAYAMGFLELHKHSVRKRRAAEYFFHWPADEAKETVSPSEVCKPEGVSPLKHLSTSPDKQIPTSPDSQFTTFAGQQASCATIPMGDGVLSGNQATVSLGNCVTRQVCNQADVWPLVTPLDYSPFRKPDAPPNPAAEPIDDSKPPLIEVDF